MAVKTLDERHRKLVEERLKGTPVTKIAEILGVSRQTLYVWWEDPLVQEYYHTLLRDIENARRERLTPVIENALCLLNEQITRFRQGLMGEAEVLDQPSIEAVARVAEKLIDKQRLEGGLPTTHSRIEKSTGDTPNPKVQNTLDRILGPKADSAADLPDDDEPEQVH